MIKLQYIQNNSLLMDINIIYEIVENENKRTRKL